MPPRPGIDEKSRDPPVEEHSDHWGAIGAGRAAAVGASSGGGAAARRCTYRGSAHKSFCRSVHNDMESKRNSTKRLDHTTGPHAYPAGTTTIAYTYFRPGSTSDVE